MALPGPSGAIPKPSRITSAREGTGMLVGPAGSGLISGGLDDRREVRGVEARATDQGAVDVGLADQLRRVVGFHGAPVENPDRRRALRRPGLDQAPDQRNR